MQIGAEDSFFDLGRPFAYCGAALCANPQGLWNVDFPISVLFEAPTIRKVRRLWLLNAAYADEGRGRGDTRL